MPVLGRRTLHSGFSAIPTVGARAGIFGLLTALTLALILGLALFLRLRDLHLAQGSLSGDEARLTLVARGIVEHGWPVLPSGHLYTRGLFQACLTALSVAMLGSGDLAPRLPSVISGVLLVAVTYLYGTSLGGRWAGLFAATLVAVYVPLIEWSRQAWFYSTFVLLWVLTLYLFDRSTNAGSRWTLVLGAAAAVLGFFTHELAILLLPAIGLLLIGWLRRCPEGSGRTRPLLLALALLGGGLGLLMAMTLALRSDTLAGSLGEVDEYLGLTNDLDGLRFYWSMLRDEYGPLLVVAAGGLFFAEPGRRARLLPLLMAGVSLFVVIAFILPPPAREQYGLGLMPLLFLLAAAGVAGLADQLRRWLPGRLVLAVAAGFYLLLLVPHLDVRGIMRNTAVERRNTSWMADLYAQGYRPGELVLTDAPTVAFLYLGRTDFWLRSRGFEKYTYQPDGLRRDIHTGAALVRTLEEFERLVREPHRGEVVWVIGSNRRWQWQSATDRDVREYMEGQAIRRRRSADETLLYKLRL